MMADPIRTRAVWHRPSAAEGTFRTWTVVLPQHPRAASIAREATGEVLATWGLSHVKEVALLVVSELVTNAVLHAQASDSPPEVRLRAESAWLRIAVHDADPRPPRLRAPAGLDEAGRGLPLVEAIADQWGVAATVEGKAVWALLSLGR